MIFEAFSSMFRRVENTIGGLLVLMAVVLLGACAAPHRLPAVPVALEDSAVVPGMADVRYFAPDFGQMERDMQLTIVREKAALAASGYNGPLPPISYLALSGGGANGAFGAGLLVGWTAHGDRPMFNVVTGVSTGALIAPFAFLGPAYDAQLKRLYTEVSNKNILSPRGIRALLFDDAMADNLPLQELVEENVTPTLLKAIAAESLKGRTLLVATTDLDADRSVLWNITLMAESHDPRALTLIRKILVASAAIPGVLPPMMLDVQAGGHRYQEMHVDGGATEQVFAIPAKIVLNKVARRDRTFYLIRNSQFSVPRKEVKRSVIAISRRAIASMIHDQGVGDMYQIAAMAKRDGAHFRLAYISDSFTMRAPKASTTPT